MPSDNRSKPLLLLCVKLVGGKSPLWHVSACLCFPLSIFLTISFVPSWGSLWTVGIFTSCLRKQLSSAEFLFLFRNGPDVLESSDNYMERGF